MSSRRSARPPGYRASRGFSLMEALLATFVLLTSLLLSIYVFHSSLRAEASNEKRVVAAAVAESALAEVREAAGTNFRGLIGAYDGMEWSLPAEPDFKIHCQVSLPT